MVELLVAFLLMVIVTGVSLVAFAKIQNRLQISKIQAAQLSLSENLKARIQSDVEGALALGAVTTNSLHFDGRRTYGILPDPFTDPGTRVSDGIEIFVQDSDSSTQTNFQLLSADCAGGASAATIRVNGDFEPTTALSEDYFVISDGDNLELYTREGAISNVSGESVFGMVENLHLCASPAASASVYRVSRIKYQIEESAGVYQFVRTENGVGRVLGEGVRSMRIFYYFNAGDSAGSKAADCAAKSGVRWFAHSNVATDCSWDLLQSVRFEMIFESDRGKDVALTPNPHTGETTDTIKTTGQFAFSPSSYSETESTP